MSTSINEEMVVKQYRGGESPYQIAKAFSTYPNKIRRILKKRGVQIRNKKEAQKNALDNGTAIHPTEGKVRSEEDKLKISSGMMNYWDVMSDEERERRSQQSKDNWDKLSEEEKREMIDRGMKAIKIASREGSKLERLVKEALEAEKYAVETHVKTLIPKESLEIDLYIRSLRVIIEIDGPSHFLPIWGDKRFQKQVQSDFRKNGVLLSKGFIVIRVKAISPLSLKRNKDLMDRILSELKEIKRERPVESKRFIEVDF